MEKITKVSLLILALLIPLAVYAADNPTGSPAAYTVADGLRVAAQVSAKCPSITQKDTPQNALPALVFAFQRLCECIPAKLAAWQAELSPTELEAPLVPDELGKSYQARVLKPCMGARFRQAYTVSCAEVFAKNRSNTEKYCQCISAKVEPLTDTQAAALGEALYDQMQSETDAQRQGQPAPEPAPAVKEFRALDQACSALK